MGASEIRPPVSPLLGRLYLEQGHLTDAEAVFRAVLELDGEDRAARDGLEAVARARTRRRLERWLDRVVSPREARGD